jgi:hypothetical protein
VARDVDSAIGNPDLSERIAKTLSEYQHLSERDEQNISKLSAKLGGDPVIRVPYLDTDVHDLAGLSEINRFLFADEATRIELAT